MSVNGIGTGLGLVTMGFESDAGGTVDPNTVLKSAGGNWNDDNLKIGMEDNVRQAIDFGLSQVGTMVGGSGVLPSIPLGIVANVASATSIMVGWNFTANAAYFDVYRSTSANGTYTKINANHITQLSYTDTGLNPNVQYYYKIKSVNNAGSSAYSLVAYATTLGGTVNAQIIKTVTLPSVVPFTGKPTYFAGATGTFFDTRFHPVAHTEENFAYYHGDVVNNSAKIMVPRQ